MAQTKRPKTARKKTTTRLKGKTKKSDPEAVKRLAALGCTMVEIASVLGLSVETVRTRHADDISEGKANLHVRLRQRQVQIADSGDVRMLIHLGRAVLNQRDKVDVTSGGKSISWLDVLQRAAATGADHGDDE